MNYKLILYLFYALGIPLFFSCQHNPRTLATSRVYYFSSTGNDFNDGSKNKPWKTISQLNQLTLVPGDTVFFEGGHVFSGNIFIDSASSGSAGQPVVLISYGNGKAIINSAQVAALTLSHTAYVKICNLGFQGIGRKAGNTKDGVIIRNCRNIFIDSLNISGFQKSGLLVYSSSGIDVSRVYTHDNGAAGIFINGAKAKEDCANIHVSYCTAENNPGDPANFTNHSGNGILAGMCRKVTIEYCVASNNGWDMPRKGNGPVGIWTYESDSVVIQHCISCRNKTSPGAADGGGFDLDGGVTNSIIQYCLSYENQGSGFGLFQYAGASNWYNNAIRFCISENDGAVSAAHAGVFVWNSSDDSSQLKDCFFYNNTVFNSTGAAISYEKQSKNSGFRFYNNIFVAKDSLITGKETNSIYLGNNWYSIHGRFNINGVTNFRTWAVSFHKEQFNGSITGSNINPVFYKPGEATAILPGVLNTLNSYRLPEGSVLYTGGLNLQQLFGINNGGKTFNQDAAPVNGVGACFKKNNN